MSEFSITGNTRMMNVKQGLVWALVHGYKDVENRSKPLPRSLLDEIKESGGVWVLLVASKADATAAHLRHVVDRLDAAADVPDDMSLPPQAIVAALRFVGCVPAVEAARASVWASTSANDFSWRIGQVWRPPSPILNVAGSQTMLRKLSTHRDNARIRRELDLNLSEERLKGAKLW